MFVLIFSDVILLLLGLTLLVGYAHGCRFMRHTFWRSQMGLLPGPAISHSAALRISLGSFRVGSHRLRAQSDHQIAREERTCVLCTSGEVENEAHFLFRCPIYYEIRGRFFCLFRECFSLYDFFSYYDQRCLALYLREATMLWDSMIQNPLPHPHSSTQLITAFFTPLSPLRGVKRPSSSIQLDEISRRVRSRSAYMH